MLRRHPTFAARATEPLAFADGALNALQDRLNAAAPWMWWPVEPPSPRRPIPPAAHMVAGAQIVAATFLPEPVIRALGGELPSGPGLWRERAVSLAAATVLWFLATGAWDRRAGRRSVAGFLGRG